MRFDRLCDRDSVRFLLLCSLPSPSSSSSFPRPSAQPFPIRTRTLIQELPPLPQTNSSLPVVLGVFSLLRMRSQSNEGRTSSSVWVFVLVPGLLPLMIVIHRRRLRLEAGEGRRGESRFHGGGRRQVGRRGRSERHGRGKEGDRPRRGGVGGRWW